MATHLIHISAVPNNGEQGVPNEFAVSPPTSAGSRKQIARDDIVEFVYDGSLPGSPASITISNFASGVFTVTTALTLNNGASATRTVAAAATTGPQSLTITGTGFDNATYFLDVVIAGTSGRRILLKRSSTAGSAPLATQLVEGELALNTADGKLFYKRSNGSIGEIAGGGVMTVAGTAPIAANTSGGTATISISAATTSAAGSMSAADKSKLDGIASGAQVNVPTNLGYTASTRVLTSSTGSNVTLPQVTTSNDGLMIAADKTKLNGIESGAQVNVGTNLTVTNGTTAGPVINSSTGTNATLPTASASISGVVTTGTQTFAGAKTFNSAVSIAAGTTTSHAVRGDRSVAAGNGLTGGGDLSANRTITLGTPGTINGSSTNSVTTSSHTHALSVVWADIGSTPTTLAGYGITNAYTKVDIDNLIIDGGTY